MYIRSNHANSVPIAVVSTDGNSAYLCDRIRVPAAGLANGTFTFCDEDGAAIEPQLERLEQLLRAALKESPLDVIGSLQELIIIRLSSEPEVELAHIRVPVDPLAKRTYCMRCDIAFMFPDSVTPDFSVVENGQRILRDFPLSITTLATLASMIVISYQGLAS